MYCSQCGKLLNEDAKFCYNCGAEIHMPEPEKDRSAELDDFSYYSQKEVSHTGYVEYNPDIRYHSNSEDSLVIDPFNMNEAYSLYIEDLSIDPGRRFNQRYYNYCLGDYTGLTRREMRRYKKQREEDIMQKKAMAILGVKGWRDLLNKKR